MTDYTLPPLPEILWLTAKEHEATTAYGQHCAEAARAPLLARIAELEAERMSLHGEINIRAVEAENAKARIAEQEAELAQAKDTKCITEAMVERALRRRAWEEDQAVWPDAYSEDEQQMERASMRQWLSAALKADGPAAYCRGCQSVGMSNCANFDECSGATCITCNRPLNDAAMKESGDA